MIEQDTETGMTDVRGRPVFQGDEEFVGYVIGFDGRHVAVDLSTGITVYLQPMRFPVDSSKETRQKIRDESLAWVWKSMKDDGYVPDNVEFKLNLRGRKILQPGQGGVPNTIYAGPVIETYLCADVQTVSPGQIQNFMARAEK